MCVFVFLSFSRSRARCAERTKEPASREDNTHRQLLPRVVLQLLYAPTTTTATVPRRLTISTRATTATVSVSRCVCVRGAPPTSFSPVTVCVRARMQQQPGQRSQARVCVWVSYEVRAPRPLASCSLTELCLLVLLWAELLRQQHGGQNASIAARYCCFSRSVSLALSRPRARRCCAAGTAHLARSLAAAQNQTQHTHARYTYLGICVYK